MANQIVAGELYESITGQLFEIGRQLRQRGGYPYDAQGLKLALQAAIEGRFPQVTFKLHLSPKQREKNGWLTGFDLEKHLEEEKLLDRTMSLDDLLVKGWLENPTTYPEDLKGKAVFLWKSQRGTGRDRFVAFLVWSDGRVIVYWYWLEFRWDGDSPVLLASSLPSAP